MSRRLLLLALAVPALACSREAAKEAAPMEYTSPDGAFSCPVPKSWELQRMITGPGLLLVKDHGKPDPSGLRAEPASMILARGYPSGNPQFKSPETFMAARPADASEPREAAHPSGWSARTFETSGTTVFPPNSVEAAEFKTRTLFVVLHKGREFFVLQLAASEGRFGAELPEFEALVAGFKPRG